MDKKRPSARRVILPPKAIPTPVVDLPAPSTLRLSEMCRRTTGYDARSLAVKVMRDDLEQGGIELLPKDKVEAIAMLIGGKVDADSTWVAGEILAIVQGDSDVD